MKRAVLLLCCCITLTAARWRLGEVFDTARGRLGEVVDTARGRLGDVVYTARSARRRLGEVVDTARGRLGEVVDTTRGRLRKVIDNLFHHDKDLSSKGIEEDVYLNAPQLITKYRYPVEIHHVTTEDGYILEMHRIPHGRDHTNTSGESKPVVFLMHGLFLSSAHWVLMGPGSGLAYILAEEGFDVWMGNARGNYYSRHHARLNPNSLISAKFWKFSWDEIGNIDLPTMIDYVLQHSGKSKLHYIGFSQGTTSFFVMGSLRPSYNEKIISMHALAPVAYMAHSTNLLMKAIAPFSNKIEIVMRLLGKREVKSTNTVLKMAGYASCRDRAVFQPICRNLLFLVAGVEEGHINATMLPVILGHTPGGASVRQVVHYAQSNAKKGFRRYDHGLVGNYLRYGSTKPPSYDLKKVNASVFFYYSDHDDLAHVDDVYRLYSELGRCMGKFRVALSSFSHLDFLLGIDAKELVYDTVISQIKLMDYIN